MNMKTPVRKRANQLIPFFLDRIGTRTGRDYGREWAVKTRFSLLELYWHPLDKDEYFIHIAGRFEDVEAAINANIHHPCFNRHSGKYNHFIDSVNVSDFQKDLFRYFDHVVDMCDYAPVLSPLGDRPADYVSMEEPWFEARLEDILPKRGTIEVGDVGEKPQIVQLSRFKKKYEKHLAAPCDCKMSVDGENVFIEARPSKGLFTDLTQKVLSIQI